MEKLPCDILYQDKKCMAVKETKPAAPVHFMVFPKKAYKQGLTGMSKVKKGEHEDIMGHLMTVTAKVAKDQGLNNNGYRVVVNDGLHGCQKYNHFHINCLGGF